MPDEQDIVERLKDRLTAAMSPGFRRDYEDALDEITRLRSRPTWGEMREAAAKAIEAEADKMEWSSRPSVMGRYLADKLRSLPSPEDKT